ncbi:hypothetical protein BGZ58_006216 [Dissophora ornata]|nr:hypothetical protein BGZ58_006216 [Dissophora ornata]
MDVLGMSDHYSGILKSTLRSSTLQGKSPLVESLKNKSKAAILFPPLSLSISLTDATNAMATSLSPSSASSSSLAALTRSRRIVPYYASCFSPLDLPSDIFVYLLEFLSPADLWRLCQVSRAMQLEVIGFMSKIQRFKFEAVRILYQEHSDPGSELVHRRHTFYDHMTFRAALSSPFSSSTSTTIPPSSLSSLRMSMFLSRTKNSGQVQSRSSFWLAQARFLVATITEGTNYEPGLAENSSTKKGACTKLSRETIIDGQGPMTPTPSASSSSSPSASSSLEDLHTSNEDAPAGSTSLPSHVSVSWSSGTPAIPHVVSAAVSPISITIQVQQQQQRLGDGLQRRNNNNNIPAPLPMERFSSMVDLIFDPSIVNLNHRRAIINCARYVSASIDESFLKAASTHDALNPVFHAMFQHQHIVNTGPYLTMFSPILYDVDGPELSPSERALTGGVESARITPPRRLHNYFQVMLWHRCMNDLILLYNRIQSRHLDVSPTSKAHHREATDRSEAQSAVCCQDPIALLSRKGADADQAELYPFCCKAHSLVFTTQYPFSFVPYPIRVHFRRIVQKIQSVSHKSTWSTAFGGIGGNENNRGQGYREVEHAFPSRRTILYTGSIKKLQFCNGAPTHPSLSTSPSSSSLSLPSPPLQSASSSLWQTRTEEEELIQRRYRVEERIRQDNLIKQEMLALCHMACGLFLADDRSPDAPPTIMSLLRQGSPWNKGVWREGEWLTAPIDALAQQQHRDSTAPYTSRSGGEVTAETAKETMGASDMGQWQKICVATIQFLAQKDLAWGGNRTNAELSRLRAASNASAWIYYE